MPKNNCIQCDNGKYKIRGKPDSECIFKELEECQNSKAGYDKGATSVADLLFSQGVSDSYDDSDDDSLTLTNTSDDDTVGGTDVDFDEVSIKGSIIKVLFVSKLVIAPAVFIKI